MSDGVVPPVPLALGRVRDGGPRYHYHVIAWEAACGCPVGYPAGASNGLPQARIYNDDDDQDNYEALMTGSVYLALHSPPQIPTHPSAHIPSPLCALGQVRLSVGGGSRRPESLLTGSAFDLHF